MNTRDTCDSSMLTPSARSLFALLRFSLTNTMKNSSKRWVAPGVWFYMVCPEEFQWTVKVESSPETSLKMWKLSHTDVCDCGERQTMSHLMTCGDAPNCTWTDLAFPTLAGVNCAKHWEESI